MDINGTPGRIMSGFVAQICVARSTSRDCHRRTVTVGSTTFAAPRRLGGSVGQSLRSKRIYSLAKGVWGILKPVSVGAVAIDHDAPSSEHVSK